MGGFYERLIGLAKRRLKKMIGNTSLNAIELQTVPTEIEATSNSRPLTYPYTDINDGPALTPSHFLCGHRLLTLPDAEEDSDYIPQESAKELTRRAKYHQKIMRAFWKQWQREYLTGLREQHSSQKNKNISGEPVARGKVVLIHDETPRNQWKLGAIIQLQQGKDGLVRSVTLRTAKGRRAILAQKNKYLNCLRSGHTRYQCRLKGKCLNCGLKHHTSISEPSEPNRDSSKRHEKQEDPQNSKNVTSAMTTLASTTTHTNTLMQAALVTASGPTTRCQTRILIDTGSQKTFITQCLKNKLQLIAAQNEILDITTFGSTTKGPPKSYEVVTLTLNAVNKDVKITALVTPIICPPLSSTQHTEIPVEFKALAFADPLNAEGDRTIDILIGNDHYAQIILGNTKKSQDERWMATQSKFGWLLSGPVPNNESSTETTLSTLCQMIDAQPTRNDDLNETLTKFWSISKIPEECNVTEVTAVQKHFQETIEFNKVTGRYNVRLPWKDSKQNLPTNFTLARKRLSNLQHTLKGKHPELIYKYNDQLLDQLKRGFIEQVLDPNIHQGVMHYMPHFPVFKENNTTAMRIVYDASAKISSKALSLNDCLHTGPNLIQRLQNMLLAFRSHKIAFTADIEKAFLQIELSTQDRDATRFLWLKDVDKSANNPDNLVVYRFCHVLFGAAPSPYLLNATIQHHLTKQDDWISEDLQRSIYMDNVVTGTDTEPEALLYYTSSRNCFQKAGMNLRQWTSNSPALNRQAHDDGVYAKPMVKVLGLN